MTAVGSPKRRALATVVVLVALLPSSAQAPVPASPPASAAPAGASGPGRVPPGPTACAGGTLVVGSPSADDLSDPLSVAGAVITWLLCGTGPPNVVSPHARQVLDRWSALAQPDVGFTIAELAFADPRAAPVSVLAQIRRQGATLNIVFTLFRRSTGAWFVDDLALGP